MPIEFHTFYSFSKPINLKIIQIVRSFNTSKKQIISIFPLIIILFYKYNYE